MVLEHWSDYFSMTVNYSLGLVGVLMNSVLIYVIHRKTPEYMKIYSNVILVGAFWDLAVAFSGIMTSTRYFAAGNSAVLMFHGLGKYLPFEMETTSKVCFIFLAIEVHGFLFSTFIIIFCLYYRKRTVVRSFEPISKRAVQIFCVLSTTLMIFYIIMILSLDLVPMSKIDELMEEVRPELINSTWIYYAILDISAFPDVFTETFAMIQGLVVVVYTLFCRQKILKTLSTLSLSPATMELQKALLKILLIQTFIPTFHIFFAIIHTIATFENDTQTMFLENSVEITVIILAAVTPNITLYFIKPYRLVLAKLVGPELITPVLVVSQNNLYVDTSLQI